ncbi:tetratricopeptide repeat protein [Aquimarina litoralis]|uniref:tetratricopeptide repeat protein n=1 Tax=Aquimarina litoralis TaxID=584605 RepID=UPI001C55ECA0|nr:tetratricopeptide repeat protein [Aquimarina litoralis]MBW1295983.1 tetratricopeptide repeat protein [Aquimarina litoralis]
MKLPKDIKYYIFILALSIFTIARSQKASLKVADSLYTIGNYTKAIKVYENIDPKDDYIFLKIAKAHKAKGTYTDALAYYEKVLQLDAELLSAKLEYAKLLTTTRTYKKADSVYASLVSQYPDNPNFYYQLGSVKKKQKDSTAIVYFKEAFKLDSTHQKSCFEVAKHYLKKRNYNRVEDVANKGLSSYSENPELINILGQNYLLRKYYYEAIPYFEKLITLNHGNEYVHASLALCYHKNYDYKLAITQYQEALKYNDQVPLRYTRMAEAFTRLDMHNEALANHTKALLLKNLPVEQEFLNVAMSHRHLENWEEAIKYAKLALKENPEFIRAQYQLAVFADAYYKDPKVKLEYYNLFMKKFGNSKDTKNFYGFMVNKRITQLEKEIQTSEKAVVEN